MSGETKWTPGPWRANRNSSYWQIEPESRDRGINGIPFTVGDVCATDPGHPDGGKQEANAHLIAAAPELFKELERLVDAFESEIRSSYEGTSSLEVRLSETGAARAALSKARGESQ